MEKRDILPIIFDICHKEGWAVEKNYKGENWKADVIVSYSNYKVSFNIGKRFKAIEENYINMKKERVCGCWLALSYESRLYCDKDLPCFYLDESDGKYFVKFNSSYSIDIENFVYLLVRGKIAMAKTIEPKFVDIYLIQNKCYRCGAINNVYFVKRMMSKDGVILSAGEDFGRDIHFNPILVRLVQKHIEEHPELDVTIGVIKHRYSKTMEESYMSFGCSKCDSIVGDFFLRELIFDRIYDESMSNIVRIDTEASDLSFPIHHWHIAKE